MDKETYQKCLKEDIRNRKNFPRCKMCGRDGSVVLNKIIFYKSCSERKSYCVKTVMQNYKR